MKLGKGELYDKKGNYVGCGPSTARSLDSLYKLLNNSDAPEQAKSGIMGIGKNKEANAAYEVETVTYGVSGKLDNNYYRTNV